MTTRRRRGEDGISFEHRGPCRDPHRHRHCPGLWRGEITTGYTADGKRTRRKVSGTTKAAVVDKLRDLHTQLDKGVTPKAGYAHYTPSAKPPRTGSPRAGRPLGQHDHEEPERPGADLEGHRRAEAPRPDRRRRPPGTGRDGRRVLHRRGLDGAPGAQAGHPARRSQRPDQPQRGRPGRHAQRPARPGRPNPLPWTRQWRSSPRPARSP